MRCVGSRMNSSVRGIAFCFLLALTADPRVFFLIHEEATMRERP